MKNKFEAQNIHIQILEGNIRSLEDQICSFVEEKKEFEIQKKKVDSLEKETEFLIALIKKPKTAEIGPRKLEVCLYLLICIINALYKAGVSIPRAACGPPDAFVRPANISKIDITRNFEHI